MPEPKAGPEAPRKSRKSEIRCRTIPSQNKRKGIKRDGTPGTRGSCGDRVLASMLSTCRRRADGCCCRAQIHLLDIIDILGVAQVVCFAQTTRGPGSLGCSLTAALAIAILTHPAGGVHYPPKKHRRPILFRGVSGNHPTFRGGCTAEIIEIGFPPPFPGILEPNVVSQEESRVPN